MWENYSYLESPIIEYVRKSKNNRTKKGMLVAGVDPDTKKVCIGWSLCNSLDEFEKYHGFDIAEGRAAENNRMKKFIDGSDNLDLLEVIPFTILDAIPGFVDRMKKYYKENEFCTVTKYLMNE